MAPGRAGARSAKSRPRKDRSRGNKGRPSVARTRHARFIRHNSPLIVDERRAGPNGRMRSNGTAAGSIPHRNGVVAIADATGLDWTAKYKSIENAAAGASGRKRYLDGEPARCDLMARRRSMIFSRERRA